MHLGLGGEGGGLGLLGRLELGGEAQGLGDSPLAVALGGYLFLDGGGGGLGGVERLLLFDGVGAHRHVGGHFGLLLGAQRLGSLDGAGVGGGGGRDGELFC
ncbi:MAG: hypothetical protein IPL39_17845 [Opitutaceae bacterium]|nr:hypothetical protein [Opitutaceae bacterium]